MINYSSCISNFHLKYSNDESSKIDLGRKDIEVKKEFLSKKILKIFFFTLLKINPISNFFVRFRRSFTV